MSSKAWMRYLRDRAKKLEVRLRAAGEGWDPETKKEGVAQVGVTDQGQPFQISVQYASKPPALALDLEVEAPEPPPTILRAAAAPAPAPAPAPEPVAVLPPQPRQMPLGPLPEITVATFVNGRPGIKRIEAPPPLPRNNPAPRLAQP